MADGDGRFLFNLIEELARLPAGKPIDAAALAAAVQRRAPIYDKAQEGHYNLISALHKSLRGSDTDAALYWLARMLDGGEDPIYILRRLTRAAVEDIGLAEPGALAQAIAAWETYDRLGSPEGELAVAQLVIYLATAPKSNAAYAAFGAAGRAARETGSLMPPAHILNAPTRLMRDLGYGKGYQYDHDSAEAFSGQNYFPDGMARQRFYDPPARGFEREIRKRLDRGDKREAEALRRLVLHRDDDVIVIDKPAGLAVQGGSGTTHHLDGMLDGLRFGNAERPRLVHRLDRDTSGVLLLARTAFAAQRLAAAVCGQTTPEI